MLANSKGWSGRTMDTARFFGAALAAVSIALPAGCGESSSDGGSNGTRSEAVPYAPYESALYSGLDNWLCNPELDDTADLCAIDLDATIVAANGETSVEEHTDAEDPPFDCFYVYPTVSADPGVFSDLEPNDEERFIISDQAARLRRHCQVFVPSYRQVTVLSVQEAGREDFAAAYEDVLDAFREYIANRNEGRGFILLSHSQGTLHAIRLVAEEIEARPYLADRMIAAYLIGGSALLGGPSNGRGVVEVPRGEKVGATFTSTPLCEREDEFGCVVAYVSFLSANPPTEGAAFGGASSPDNVVACVNPAALDGGPAILDPYFPSEIGGLFGTFVGNVSPWAEPEAQEPIATPFYKMPDFLEGECEEQNGYNFLSLTPLADPSDPRADGIKGELDPIVTGWGTHLVDVTIAMGDILNLIEQQAASWAASQ